MIEVSKMCDKLKGSTAPPSVQVSNEYMTTHEGDTINVLIRKSPLSGLPTVTIDVNGESVALSLIQLNALGLALAKGVVE